MTAAPTLIWRNELVQLVNLLLSEHKDSADAIRWWDTPIASAGNRTPATVIMEAVHPFQEDIESILRDIGGSHDRLHRDLDRGS